MPTFEEGQTFIHERTFTVEDVRQFADVTGDTQARHTDPDEDGRVLVQGLLTGSLLTKIGGDHEVLASRIDFRFRRPVYSGDTVRCAWTNERVTDRPDGVELEASVVCRRVESDDAGEVGDSGEGDDASEGADSHGEVVLEATVEGVVYE